MSPCYFSKRRAVEVCDNDEVFRTGDIEQLVNKANAFSLLSNSVVAWNTD